MPRRWLARFGERGLFADIGAIAVKILYTFGDQNPLHVVPRPPANPVPRIDRRLTAGFAGTQVSPPSVVSSPRSFRQRLTVSVRTSETSQIGSIARPDTGHKETHVLGRSLSGYG